MNLFEASDYRIALKELLKEKAARGERITLRKLAERLGIQHTYLSKVLNPASSAHLGEDALSECCQHLGLSPEEEEFIFFLRSHAVSQSPQRRKRLLEKIEQMRHARKLNVPRAESDRLALEKESAYLLNPLAVLMHVALTISKFQKSPLDLAGVFGIGFDEIRSTLNQLADSGLIEMSEDRKRITAMHRPKMHFGIDHPLMRSHQHNLRSFGIARLMRLGENQRKAFTVAFTADVSTYGAILKRFDAFIEEARDIANGSEHDSIYQLNFDLFPWN